MKQTVLHIASGDAWGGAERVMEVLLKAALTSDAVEIECLLLNDGRLAQTLREMGTSVHVISESDRSFRSLQRDVRAWIASRDFVVIHCHRYKEILLALLARGRRRPPIVATIHGLEPLRQLTMKNAIVVWAALLLARAYGTHFAAVSEELAERLRRSLRSNRVVEIPNPMPQVDNSSVAPDIRAHFGWAPDRPLVGFIGRLEPVKGPDLYLDVAARAPAGAAFVLIGSGSMDAELRARSEREGLGDRLGFFGEVPDASQFLRQLDVLAMTSRHEGTPMAILEAAACDVPVVAFGVGGIPRLLEGTPATWSASPGDVDAFDRGLREVLVDSAGSRRDAIAWAAALRPRFSPSAVLSSYLDLYARASSMARGSASREANADQRRLSS